MDLVGPTFVLPVFLELCPDYQILPFEYQFLMDVVGPKFQPVFDGGGRSQNSKKGESTDYEVFILYYICF